MADVRKPAIYRVWDDVLGQYVILLFETDASQVTYQNGVLHGKNGEEVAVYILGVIDAHVSDGAKHLTSTEKTAVGNLPADTVTALSNLNTALTTHTGNTDIHVSVDWKTILEDLETLADVPTEIFATKDEMNQMIAGLTKPPLQVADITDRDALTTGPSPISANQWVWVSDPTDDTDNISGPGTALYIWSGTDWLFIMQMEGVVIPPPDWTQMINGPSSTPGQIDAAVTASHTHANKTAVLDKLSADVDGDLNFDGAKVFNPADLPIWVTVSPDEPSETPFAGKVWIETAPETP